MIYLVLATILFSLSFGLIKSQLAVLPTEFVVFTRLLIAGLIFLPFFKTCNIKIIMKAFLIGIIQFGLMYLCFIKAFKYLNGNEIAVLTTSTPIFVALWSILTGAKFKFTYLVCIILSIIGAVIILWDNTTLFFIIKGIFLMELCNCAFALGQVLWKKHILKNDLNLISIAYLGACLFVLPFLILNVNLTVIKLTSLQILSLLYLGIIPTGIGFWLWNKGSKKVSYSLLAVMNNLKIPFGILFSIFIFHEKINLINFLIGGSIILTSILLLKNQESINSG